jgi:hypothetical protein
MNPTGNKSKNHRPKKSKLIKKEVRKKLSQENETLTLVDIAKDIDEVKTEGFGRIVIFVQNGRIYRWELVKSRTKKNLTSFGN